mmetsp:Transcript_41146/g.131667  ORF Transcript_41146/g.131667 Transcript_41146/m.131667 type:complete len:157 (-) Transcript_41146:1442-1912(-)
MDKVTTKYRQLYARAGAAVDEWGALQRRGSKLMANATNALGRIPVLADEGNLGALSLLPGVAQRVQAKQVGALERILARLLDTMGDMRAVCGTLEKLAVDGAGVLQSAVGGTPTGLAARAGAAPSVAECIEGLQDLSMMHAEECAPPSWPCSSRWP